MLQGYRHWEKNFDNYHYYTEFNKKNSAEMTVFMKMPKRPSHSELNELGNKMLNKMLICADRGLTYVVNNTPCGLYRNVINYVMQFDEIPPKNMVDCWMEAITNDDGTLKTVKASYEPLYTHDMISGGIRYKMIDKSNWKNAPKKPILFYKTVDYKDEIVERFETKEEFEKFINEKFTLFDYISRKDVHGKNSKKYDTINEFRKEMNY